MKKILSCFVALFAAASLYATDLNIYASGLKVHQTASGATIDYMLNAPATTLNVYIYGPANTVTPVKTIDLSTDAANLTKGAHAGVAIDLTGLPDAVYTWAIEAGAAAHDDFAEVLPSSSDYYFYGPRGVAVDNCPESPYFGRVYVSNSYAGKTASDPNCRDTYQGMYIFDATLAPLFGGNCYNGGVTWTQHGVVTVSDGSNTDWGPYRIAIDEEGYVFVCDNGAADGTCTGVYMMDPEHPENSFVSVLGQAGTNFHRANSLAVSGSGDNRVLYLNDWTDSIVSYPVGNNFPYTKKGVAAVPNLAASKIVNAQNSIARDNNGGFWVSQYRGQLDQYHQLAHFNTSGQLDCSISTGNNETLAVPRTRRGALGLSPSNEFVVIGGGGTVQVIRISDNGGVPELSSLGVDMPDDIGNNVDGLAIDYADNVYIVSATKELLRIFAIPKAENKCTTPAPSAEYISLPCVEHLYEIGDNQGWALNAGVEMTKIATNVFQGEFTFANATSYFTLSAALGTSADDWATVNASRYGADNGNEPISNGLVKSLHLGWGNSFAIPAGKYRITADLNALTVTVKQLWDNIYMFNNITGDWVLGDGVALTKTAENVFELDECEIPEGKYIIFSSTHGAGWDNVNAGRLYPESEGNFWVDGDGYASISATPADDKTLLIKAAGKYAFTIDLNEGKIFYTQLTAKVSFDSEIGYATYYNSKKGYTMPANVTGYAFNYPGAGLTQAFEAGDDVPAGVALVLAGPAGTFDLVLKTGVPAVDLANQLRGTDADELTTAPGEGVYLFYGLSLANPAPELLPNPTTVGFYWMAEDGGAFINKAHKAYLALEENVFDPEFLAPAILFNENNATNIENVEGQEKAVKFIENGQIFIRKDGVVYDAMGRVIR